VKNYEELDRISRSKQEPYGCHGYEHTKRVVDLCKVIGEELGAKMDVLIPAAILHDIGRSLENHAAQGAVQAREILENNGLYPRVIDEIIHAIEVHSFSGGGKAKTLEAKILSDADKLDAMGAIGVYRAAQYSVEHSREFKDFIGHFYEKLLTLPDLLYTEKAREMAGKRHEFLQLFLEQVDLELKGLV
jgi:uncharacterized protein